ncbi:MAG: hypothetical protein ISP01_01885 [Methanobrevibacter arboriphilus]|uniref:Uncharacterized protein n=1 Tax=Methanobrevibacter arboriphilus TaxID=39441 RepID=A0A843ABT5_METAZ|nr:hypothetical protein [Methanobrevibacter arboriphilus]MBF4468134.1 hypothetical protein [Methanobrevibacter arboriphilus]
MKLKKLIKNKDKGIINTNLSPQENSEYMIIPILNYMQYTINNYWSGFQ